MAIFHHRARFEKVPDYLLVIALALRQIGLRRQYDRMTDITSRCSGGIDEDNSGQLMVVSAVLVHKTRRGQVKSEERLGINEAFLLPMPAHGGTW